MSMINRSIGDWYVMSGQLYVVVNSGGTVEKHGHVKWYRRLWLEILECFGKKKSLDELREFINK